MWTVKPSELPKRIEKQIIEKQIFIELRNTSILTQKDRANV